MNNLIKVLVDNEQIADQNCVKTVSYHIIEKDNVISKDNDKHDIISYSGFKKASVTVNDNGKLHRFRFIYQDHEYIEEIKGDLVIEDLENPEIIIKNGLPFIQ